MQRLRSVQTVLRYRLRYLDRRELDDDTAVDSSDVQADIITASFSDAVQSSRLLRAYLEANGCLDSADGGCVLCIGEKGSALMVHGGVRKLRLTQL